MAPSKARIFKSAEIVESESDNSDDSVLGATTPKAGGTLSSTLSRTKAPLANLMKQTKSPSKQNLPQDIAKSKRPSSSGASLKTPSKKVDARPHKQNGSTLKANGAVTSQQTPVPVSGITKQAVEGVVPRSSPQTPGKSLQSQNVVPAKTIQSPATRSSSDTSEEPSDSEDATESEIGAQSSSGQGGTDDSSTESGSEDETMAAADTQQTSTRAASSPEADERATTTGRQPESSKPRPALPYEPPPGYTKQDNLEISPSISQLQHAMAGPDVRLWHFTAPSNLVQGDFQAIDWEKALSGTSFRLKDRSYRFAKKPSPETSILLPHTHGYRPAGAVMQLLDLQHVLELPIIPKLAAPPPKPAVKKREQPAGLRQRFHPIGDIQRVAASPAGSNNRVTGNEGDEDDDAESAEEEDEDDDNSDGDMDADMSAQAAPTPLPPQNFRPPPTLPPPISDPAAAAVPSSSVGDDDSGGTAKKKKKRKREETDEGRAARKAARKAEKSAAKAQRKEEKRKRRRKEEVGAGRKEEEKEKAEEQKRMKTKTK